MGRWGKVRAFLAYVHCPREWTGPSGRGQGLTGSRLPAGHAAPSRIVWEHTRGRYSCMQCAFSTASRPAMTLHLEDHRPVAPVAPASGQPRPDPDARAGKARELADGVGGAGSTR